MRRLQQYLDSINSDIYARMPHRIVMGNEAADLDSMASGIAYAFLLDSLGKGRFTVPLIPIPSGDFRLRSEAVFVFRKAGLDPGQLIFLDDVNTDQLLDNARELVLVDHNRLASRFDRHAGKVTRILDHHEDEHAHACVGPCVGPFVGPGVGQKIIQPVGSTATLVGEAFLREAPDLVDRCLALLLSGTILLDTVNLDAGAGRVTPRDRAVAETLLPICRLDPAAYFEQIQREKFNTAGLTTHDLLRKDYKAMDLGPYRCGIATVLLSLSDWHRRDPDLASGFRNHAWKRTLDLLISMNAYSAAYSGGGNRPAFRRDLIVYAREKRLHDRVLRCFDQNGLDLRPMSQPSLDSGEAAISFFHQGNTDVSRKMLIPLLQTHLRK